MIIYVIGLIVRIKSYTTLVVLLQKIPIIYHLWFKIKHFLRAFIVPLNDIYKSFTYD